VTASTAASGFAIRGFWYIKRQKTRYVSHAVGSNGSEVPCRPQLRDTVAVSGLATASKCLPENLQLYEFAETPVCPELHSVDDVFAVSFLQSMWRVGLMPKIHERWRMNGISNSSKLCPSVGCKKACPRAEQWVSQAEAAQMRGVSRQAIVRLVKKGRFTTLCIAGKILLKKSEVEHFKPKPPGPAPKNAPLSISLPISDALARSCSPSGSSPK